MSATKRALDEGAGRQEAKPRCDCVRDAAASVRTEGLAVSDAARSLIDLHGTGQISEAGLIAAIRQMHAGRCRTPPDGTQAEGEGPCRTT